MAQKITKDNIAASKEYWKNIRDFQDALNTNKKFDLPTNLKHQILNVIKESIGESNFLVSKLLIYGRVNNEVLLNFLFYVSVNTQKIYDLFIFDTDKFCRKFMFNVSPNELPNALLYFSLIDFQDKKINITKMMNDIESCNKEKLISLFPKSYKHNYKTNPFVREIG